MYGLSARTTELIRAAIIIALTGPQRFRGEFAIPRDLCLAPCLWRTREEDRLSSAVDRLLDRCLLFLADLATAVAAAHSPLDHHYNRFMEAMASP